MCLICSSLEDSVMGMKGYFYLGMILSISSVDENRGLNLQGLKIELWYWVFLVLLVVSFLYISF